MADFGSVYRNVAPLGSAPYDYVKGASGQNQADFGEARLKTERSDQERALGLQSRGLQEQYGGLLRAQMMGQGPSVAGQQLAQGRDTAVRAAMTAAASARGANVGLAGRSAAMGAAGATMQSARDAATLRAQEQLAAQQQYGALLQAQRQQDLLARGITSEGERAQLQAGTAYNALAEKAGEANAAGRQKFYGGLTSALGGLIPGVPSDVRAKTDIQPAGYTPWWLQPQQPNHAYSPGQLDSIAKQLGEQESGQQAAQPPAAAPQQQGGLGGFLSNFGGAISDPGTKEGAAPQQHGALVKAAAAVQPYSFRYRPEAAAQQGVSTDRRVGVMANGGPGSLESNPVYAPAVSVGPDGLKRVDSGQATMANIAVTSDLAKKVEEQGAQLAALRKAYQVAPAANTGEAYQSTVERRHPRMGKAIQQGFNRAAGTRSADTSLDEGNKAFGEYLHDPQFRLPRDQATLEALRGEAHMGLPTADIVHGAPSANDILTERQSLKEDQVGNAAALVMAAKKASEKRNGLQKMANAMSGQLSQRRGVSQSGYNPRQVNPQRLLEEARSRGAKNVTLKDAKDALRDEYEL